MSVKRFVFPIILFIFIFVISSCEKKYPSVNEVPKIKDLIGKLQREVKAKNAAAIDSLIIAEAYDEGYSSSSILNEIYTVDHPRFFAFANKEIVYKADKGEVTFNIVADSTDREGRSAGMTIVKIEDAWYIKRFELK